MTSSSLVRVQVVGDGRRLDVCLPSRVPVWEFLPEVLRGLEWPERVTPAGLVTVSGTALVPEQGLAAQGVGDGDVLTVAAQDEHRPPVLHDDLVEAVHDRSRQLLASWTPEATRMLTVWATPAAGAAVLALLVGLGAPGGTSALLAAGVLLVAVTSAWATASRPSAVQAAAAWLATAAAWVVSGDAARVVGGLGPDGATWTAAATALGVGVVLATKAGPAWPLHVPPLVVAGAVVASAGVARAVGVPPWQVLVVALAAAVLAAGAVPGLVAEVTVHRGHAKDGDHRLINPDRLAADVLLAHRLVLALHLTTSVLLLLVIPAAVATGPATAAAVALLVVLRTVRLRHQRSRALVLAGVSGTVAWVVVASTVVVLVHPDWVPAAGVALLASAAVAQVTELIRGTGAWWAWCADVVEVALVVAVPLAVTGALWWTTTW